MDFHTAKDLKIYQQNGEPFYHSPAHQSDDMVCEGSDSEQTEEEIWLKRLRYEDHAQRYMRGCLPTLQSARLRGPLEDRREWSNPWRYIPPERPGRLRNGRDTAPSSIAQAVVEANIDRPSRTSSARRRHIEYPIVVSSRPDDTNSSAWLTDNGTTQRSQHVNRTLTQHQSYSRLTGNNAPASTDDDSPGEATESGARSMKRASDTQWLKGSYISRRARWDGPAMTTPTPNPETLDQKLQRKPRGPSRLGELSGYPYSANTNPFGSLPDIPRKIQPKESQETTGLNHTIELESTVFRYRQPSNRPSWTPDGFHSLTADSLNLRQIIKDDGRIESSFYAQRGCFENSIAQSPETHSSSQPHILRNNVTSSIISREYSGNTSILPLESHQTPGEGAYYQDIQSTESVPYTLPKLPRQISSTERKEESGSEDELSFVTEVAPSSRNLEEFQFRKKRARNSRSSSAASKNSDRNSRPIPRSLPVSAPPQSAKAKHESPPKQATEPFNLENGLAKNFKIHNQKSEEVEVESETDEGEDEQEEDVLASGPYRQWYEAKSTKSQDNVDSYSEFQRLHGSSGNLEDVVKTPKTSACNATESTSGAVSSKHTSSIRKNPTVALALQPNSTHGSRHNRTPSGRTKLPSVPQPSPSRLSSKREIPTTLLSKGYPEHVYIDGSSTQSFNTTPARSARDEILQRSPFQSSQVDKRTDQEEPPLTDNKRVHGDAQFETQQTSSPEPFIECRLDSPPESRHSDKSPGASNSSQRSSVGRSQSPWAQSHEGTRFIKEVATPNTKIPPVTAETSKPKTSVAVHSQALGPGEQSPWAAVHNFPLPKTIPVAVSATNLDSSNLFAKVSPEQESGWQPIECQALPENDGIRSSSDMMTPPRVSSISQTNGEQSCPSAQVAATTNPWTTNEEKSAPKKSDKRVSFGILSDDSEESEQDYYPRRLGCSPPPWEPGEFVEIEEALNDSTFVTGFKKHFSTFKQPRRLLPEDSQPTGSPSIGAMAEAFIAADRDLLVEEERKQKLSEPSRHLKPTSPTKVNTVPRDSATFESTFSRDFLDSSPPPAMGPVQTPGFDMDEAMGGFAEFLGDWSVEGELQKVKNASSAPTRTPARGVESNGTKRRRLFGIA